MIGGLGDLIASHNGYTGARESGMVEAHIKLGMIVGHTDHLQAHDPERFRPIACWARSSATMTNRPHLIRGMLEAYIMQDLTNSYWSTCTG